MANVLQVGHSAIRAALSKGSSALAKLDRLKEKTEEMTGQVVQVVEVGAAAFGFGVIKGRWGAVEVVGVPVDLAAGVALHVLAFTGIAGKYGEHMHSLANGALAVWAGQMGTGVGAKLLDKANAPKATAQGEFGFSQPGQFAAGYGSPAADAVLHMARTAVR